jgi:hypothetical protein
MLMAFVARVLGFRRPTLIRSQVPDIIPDSQIPAMKRKADKGHTATTKWWL